MNKQDLIDFEEEIAKIYETGVIKGPIHLRTGAEDELIEIFQNVRKNDYVFATWANHREALLKGIPREEVKQRILDGHSMAMNFPEYNFYTSAIVGGICPIAAGVAYALKRQHKNNRVYAFIGDMTFLNGDAHNSLQYSLNFDLPITWIVMDNNKSVCTITEDAWGTEDRKNSIGVNQLYLHYTGRSCKNFRIKVIRFESKWPHSATGTFVSF